MEIERKYAILKMPEDLSGYEKKIIEQGYLCHNPTLRIRKSNEDYILTYKSKVSANSFTQTHTNVNNEVELPLSEEAYITLKAKTDGNMIYKTRYLIPLEDGLTAELDVFEGFLAGLIYVEVEFPDLQSAEKFKAPAWFGKNLTPDKRFTNYSLSLCLSPPEIDA